MGAGSSAVTLSVSISTRASSASKESPTCLSQRPTVPSVTDSPSSGTVISIVSALAAALGVTAAGVAAGAGDGATGAASAFAAGALAWAFSSIAPITLPTSTSAPSSAVIWVNTPELGAGTSTVTLSVSISTSGSSAVTASPTALNQRAIVPSVTDSPISGTLISVAIFLTFLCVPCCARATGLRLRVFPVRAGGACRYRLPGTPLPCVRHSADGYGSRRSRSTRLQGGGR